MDQFIHDFPFLKDKIEQNRKYLLTKEDLEMIADEISLSDSIQQFGIPPLNRVNTLDYSHSPVSLSMFSLVFNALKLNSSIRSLDLRWDLVGVSKLIAEVIMITTSITDLRLHYNLVDMVEIMSAIRMSPSIQTLDISGCRHFTDKVFEDTRGTNPNLTMLNISGIHCSFEYIAEWLKHSVNLASLTLSGLQFEGNGRDAFCKWIRNCPTLTELAILDVGNCFEGAEESLKNHGKLQKFTLKGANRLSKEGATLSLLESVSFNRSIHYLDFSNSFRHLAYVAPIGRLIKNLPLLTELNLKSNLLPDNIGDALRRSLTLTTLNLWDCFEDPQDTMKVCEALHNHPTLTWLDLGGFTYGHIVKRISSITKLLQTKIPLKTLYFDVYSEDGEGIITFAEVLKNNHSLTFLSLAGNRCENEGAIAFAECLKVNTTLTQLILDNNDITDDGVIAIAQSLETNNSLKLFDLSANEITDNGLSSLLHMLDINTTLTRLKMLHCLEMDSQQKVSIQQKYGRRLVF
eukprot:TRINITY_DN2199_c1_g5_i1.p1 TRINITY_DN2199_c1_g5~~TRINITY_DN2199_c1_g5_i1.p1  ORF type:complete len:532 (-),score=77.71 TRINITY_DN2199_c1_g5_i1:76-1626(-)